MREQIVALFNEGKSYGVIAKELGTTRNAVAGHIHREGLKRPFSEKSLCFKSPIGSMAVGEIVEFDINRPSISFTNLARYYGFTVRTFRDKAAGVLKVVRIA